jgi:nicotinamide-nucleotide amidase
MYEFCSDYEKIFENIVASAYTHIAAQKVNALVIGMSGGIDSTLTAAIAREVTDRMGTGVKLVGRVIDIESDPVEMKRAVKATNTFCHGQGPDVYCDMTSLYMYAAQEIMWVGSNSDSLSDRIRRGNIKARFRMIKLYDLANSLGGLVLSTDNYTEYLLGFWTLHGDVGDFGMLQNLWKTEVYGLAEYMRGMYNRSKQYDKADSLNECIEAMATDGLGVTDTDFDQLLPGYSSKWTSRQLYEVIDVVLAGFLKDQWLYYDGLREIHKKIIDRHVATKFKRNNPFNIPREYIVK